eukprot:5820878-Pyramimonas_sp.AAC.1
MFSPGSIRRKMCGAGFGRRGTFRLFRFVAMPHVPRWGPGVRWSAAGGAVIHPRPDCAAAPPDGAPGGPDMLQAMPPAVRSIGPADLDAGLGGALFSGPRGGRR